MAPRPELDAITARLDAGESVAAVAADAGVTERTIRNRLHRAGLPLASSRSRDRRRARLDDAAWLSDQHLAQSQNASTIARRLGVSTVEVRAALDRFDIPLPPVRPELTAEALRAAFAAGETVSSIARRVGIDRSGVRQRMRRHEITNPHYRPVERPALLDDADWLRSRYVTDAVTIKQIATGIGVGPSTVDRALRRAGIERRPQGRSAPGGFDADWLRDAYVVRRVPVADIAEQLGSVR